MLAATPKAMVPVASELLKSLFFDLTGELLLTLSEIEHEKTEVELRERIGSFSKESLKHTETEEKFVLPTEEGTVQC